MPDKFNLFTAEFLRAAAVRAIKTAAQFAVGLIGTATVLSDVEWTVVASGALVAALLSLLTSIGGGLPEAD